MGAGRPPRRRSDRGRPAAAALAAVAAVAAVVATASIVPTAGPTPPVRAASAAQPSLTTAAVPVAAKVPRRLRAEPHPGRVSTAPPASSDPEHPGQTVPSGQNESDPFLLVDGGMYFLYTSGMPPAGSRPSVNVPVALSTDMTTWSRVIDAMPTLPHWAVDGFTWAPDIHHFGDTWVLYFTAAVVASGQECIGAATGHSPIGPFTPEASPFICQSALGGSIDPRVFIDANGTPWMLWKSDQNINGAPTPTTMWSERLAPDGLGLVGGATTLLQPDRPWQGTVVEAPDMIEAHHDYWLTYSGNWFNQPDYAVGAALCAGPGGPCADPSSVPLLASNDQGLGPGEASVFAGRGGLWLLYSPWYFPSRTGSLEIQLSNYTPRPVDITRIGVSDRGVYLAAGGPPPALAILPGPLLWVAHRR